MKIYAISGLGADQRVFEKLNLDRELIPIHWITPIKHESIQSYTKRLSSAIDQSEDYVILGVSFGGLIATEISKILNPKLTILISSVETKDKLRFIYRWIGNTKLLHLVPTILFDPPRGLATYIFGAKNKQLLHDILDDTDLNFAKWAALQLTTWKNTSSPKNLLKIHGTKDKLIPLKTSMKTIIIEDGAHFMIVDRADEISKIINTKLAEFI